MFIAAMKNNKTEWHLPEEILGLLSAVFFMPIMAAIALLTATLLPDISSIRNEAIARVFWVGISAGAIGIVTMFFAKLPLYQQRHFWSFGPKYLDQNHRRLYWLAYCFVIVCVALLSIVWLKTR